VKAVRAVLEAARDMARWNGAALPVVFDVEELAEEVRENLAKASGKLVAMLIVKVKYLGKHPIVDGAHAYQIP
jgi:RES domain-containing protein